LENGATKAIADVVVGDRILTVNTKTGAQVYSDVAYVPHGKNAEKAVFTVLATEAGRDVKMTANHMLPAGACDAAGSLPVVAASTISAGDCVQTVSGRERVVSVGTVAGEGIYTVIAMEELIVVNGVVATPYGGVNPTLANVYYNLHRLAYSVVGKALLAAHSKHVHVSRSNAAFSRLADQARALKQVTTPESDTATAATLPVFKDSPQQVASSVVASSVVASSVVASSVVARVLALDRSRVHVKVRVRGF
jgi:hypothetical protein